MATPDSSAPIRIGVDLGGTKIEALAIDAAGRELARRRIRSPSHDYQQLVDAVYGLVAELEQGLGRRARVGIGTPGAVSRTSGLIQNANSTVLNGQPFATDIADALARELAARGIDRQRLDLGAAEIDADADRGG